MVLLFHKAKLEAYQICCKCIPQDEAIANLRQFLAKHVWCGCLVLAVENCCCCNAVLLAKVDRDFYLHMPAVDDNRELYLVNASYSNFPCCISHAPLVLSNLSLKIK